MHPNLNWVFSEIARLADGGEMSERLATRLSPEERLAFEIGVIDLLSTGPAERHRRLRRALIRGGYEDQCARRAMRDAVPDRVRAVTILALLHPPAHKRDRRRATAAGETR